LTVAMHVVLRRAGAVALAAAIIAAGTSPAGALASRAASRPSPAGASRPTPTSQLEHSLAVLISTRTVIPRVQRTVGFNGYATYSFSAPRGRRIVSASARIVGAAGHAVAIRRATVSRNRMRFTVRLVFPGEQGNPGKLVVRLGTVG
jgi:hypothetical protein